MDDLSSRYLDAFNAIEKWLRTQVTSQERMDLLYVEVKGTQTKGEEIILTSGEVDFARRHREQMALFVVHSIKVSDKKKLTNGTERPIVPWDVDQGSLKPMSHKHKLP